MSTDTESGAVSTCRCGDPTCPQDSFGVRLYPTVDCAVRGCAGEVGYVAILQYCSCGDDAQRPGVPCPDGGDPESEADRFEVRLCETHAAGVRVWDCLRRIQSSPPVPAVSSLDTQ